MGRWQSLCWSWGEFGGDCSVSELDWKCICFDVATILRRQDTIMRDVANSKEDGNMPEIQSLINHVQRLNGDVDFWNRWMQAGLVLTAIAALWLAFTTWKVIIKGKELSVAQTNLGNAEETNHKLELATANKATEDEKLARIQLEEALAWRRLPPPQRVTLASSLRRFTVGRTWLIYNVNDSEAFGFAYDLAHALNLAKWNPTEPESVMKMAEGPVPLGTNPPLARGITVSSTGEESYFEAADALVAELLSLGFDAIRSQDTGMHPRNPVPTVFVTIEPRPEGPQGNAKLRREYQPIHRNQFGTPHTAPLS